MDARDRRKLALRLHPWLGFAIAGAAVILGLRAIAAGTASAGLAGYAAGSIELGAGIVVGRRTWMHRFDQVFAAAVAVVFFLGLVTFVAFDPPPTVYERLVRR